MEELSVLERLYLVLVAIIIAVMTKLHLWIQNKLKEPSVEEDING